MIDTEKFGINVSLRLKRLKYTSEIKKSNTLKFWVFWRNKPYPENFIGTGVPTISRELGISLEESTKLVILKLEELLPTVQDTVLKEAVEKRINDYRSPKDKLYKCRRCEKPFKKTHYLQKNCEDCRKWYRKNSKFAKKPQPQQGITNEEKQLLKGLR